jgi:hypothetical protein
MEPDDVVFPQDEPPPSPSRRRHRYALTLVATFLAAGAVTAGASALTSSSDEPSKRPATSERRQHSLSYTADGVPYERSGPECKAGHAAKRRTAAKVKY